LVNPSFIRRAGEKLPAASRRCSGCLTIGAFSPLSITDFSLQNSLTSKFFVFFYSFHWAWPVSLYSIDPYSPSLPFIPLVIIDLNYLLIGSICFVCPHFFKETPTAVASILPFSFGPTGGVY